MGKRKIGEIYNKPIVEGDINLKTPNEIHKSELSGGKGEPYENLKEYYYRILDPSVSQFMSMAGLPTTGVIIYRNPNDPNSETIEYLFSQSVSSQVVAIRLTDAPVRVWGQYDGTSLPSNFIKLNGDLYQKLSEFYQIVQPSMDPKDFIASLKNIAIEISEDEYYSLVTYKG